MSYPLVITGLDRLRCVVVGGGAVAERKVGELLAGGARPVVISPTLTAALAAWRDADALTHLARGYAPGDLAGAALAIAATDDRGVNAAVAAEGLGRGILVNVVDDPAAGNVHTPAVVRRGDLLLTVSTGGASPALAARIRGELAQRYDGAYARLLAWLRELRHGPARTLTPAGRRRLWQRLTSDDVLAWLRAGDDARATDLAEAQIAALRAGTGGVTEPAVGSPAAHQDAC
jgi:siroheme synthase-like protein